jgi:hypothetical protein
MGLGKELSYGWVLTTASGETPEAVAFVHANPPDQTDVCGRRGWSPTVRPPLIHRSHTAPARLAC